MSRGLSCVGSQVSPPERTAGMPGLAVRCATQSFRSPSAWSGDISSGAFSSEGGTVAVIDCA